MPSPPTFVADLVPSPPDAATGSKVSYMRQTARDANAAPVPPGQPKPESSYSVARIEADVVTIADIVTAIRKQDLNDAAFWRSSWKRR